MQLGFPESFIIIHPRIRNFNSEGLRILSKKGFLNWPILGNKALSIFFDFSLSQYTSPQHSSRLLVTINTPQFRKPGWEINGKKEYTAPEKSKSFFTSAREDDLKSFDLITYSSDFPFSLHQNKGNVFLGSPNIALSIFARTPAPQKSNVDLEW